MHNVSIVLVEPQMGENIGNIARVMFNFMFSDLRIVQPRDCWPNNRALQLSKEAKHIIRQAKIYNSVLDAIKDRNYIYALTARSRNLDKKHSFCHVLSQDDQFVDNMQNSKIAILIGKESSGLSNEDLLYAHEIISINANNTYSSMNISHATTLICYEMFNILKQAANKSFTPSLAKLEEIVYFQNQLILKLEEKNFFENKQNIKILQDKIRSIFMNKSFSSKEINLLMGILQKLTVKK